MSKLLKKQGDDFQCSKPWDKKHQFCKNEPEKLLKTKDRPLKMGQNEPEKSFRFSGCGKMNRKGSQNEAADPAENRIVPANEAESSQPVWLRWMLIRQLGLRARSASRACGVMAPLNAA